MLTPLGACVALIGSFLGFAYASTMYSRLCMLRYKDTGRHESFANSQTWFVLAWMFTSLASLLALGVVSILIGGVV